MLGGHKACPWGWLAVRPEYAWESEEDGVLEGW